MSGRFQERTRNTMQKTIDILIVDDSDLHARITSAAVRQVAPGASLVRVKDGEQAIRLMFCKGLFTEAPHIPRLILLELNVPRANGCAVLRRLHAQADVPTVPVIVLTTNADSQALAESYALGARACLIKPANADEYLHQVANVIDRFLS
jgi:CheY-like chemotaxis protein